MTRRLGLFTWVLAGVLLAALVFLPNKARAIMLAPVLVVTAGLDWQWRHRWRPRRIARDAVDLERMKRAN